MKRIGTTAAGLLTLFAVACGGDANVETAESEHTGGGEAAAAEYEGPITGDPAAGEAVFANNCAGCHPGVGPDLQAHHASAAETRMIIRHGEDRMPAFGADRISDADLENVLAYLQGNYGMFAE